MFRILQVKQNQVKDELISYAHLSEKWVKEIYLHTEINLLTVFAQPTLDKDNVNFVTSFTGQYEEIDTNNPELYSEFIDKHQKKVTKVIAYLNNTETFSDSELNSSKEILCSILKSLDKKYIFEKRNVIAIPYFLKNYSEPTPIVPSKTPFNKSWYLSLTLIPLIVGLLFYFCNDYIYGQKKCFTVDAQNQYSQFTIAFDASESMLEKEGNVDKLSAAKGATKTLIKNIYPNIDINFIEINGCPYAQEYLKDNYEEFKGALYEDSLYSEFNDSPNGPSQRITKLSLRLQTVTNRSSYSIDIVMDTMQEIFSMFLKGMFLPQEDDYELTSSFIEETIKFDYSESAGISIGFNDKIFGPELGHWVAEISTEKTRKQIWTEVQTNYQKYTEIIKELDEMINFIY